MDLGESSYIDSTFLVNVVTSTTYMLTENHVLQVHNCTTENKFYRKQSLGTPDHEECSPL